MGKENHRWVLDDIVYKITLIYNFYVAKEYNFMKAF